MSVKLAKLLAVFVGNKDSTIGKIGKGEMCIRDRIKWLKLLKKYFHIS